MVTHASNSSTLASPSYIMSPCLKTKPKHYPPHQNKTKHTKKRRKKELADTKGWSHENKVSSILVLKAWSAA